MHDQGNSPAGRTGADIAADRESAGPQQARPELADAAWARPGDTDTGPGWLSAGRFSVILAACIFATCPEVVLGLRTFFFRDFGYFGYPLAFHHRESFWRGEVPLWNPLSNCGLPFLAQWNTLVLYPGSLFYLLLPLTWSAPVFCLAHQFLAGLGMYFLAARWTGSRFAGGLAGMIFAFNGLTLNSLMWPNNIAALGWMPWIVLETERAWRDGGRPMKRAVVFGAMQMLAGAPEIILFTWTLAGCLFLLRLAGARSPATAGRWIGRGLAVALPVAGLAAVQLLPFFDLLAHSQRDTGFGQSSWSMPVTGWANFLVPLFHCFSANQGVFFQYDQWWTSSYYLGVGPVVLGLGAVSVLKDPRARLLLALAVVSVVLSMGDGGRLYYWLRHIFTQFGFLRYPIKFVVLAVFCLPLLAAFGASALESRARKGRLPSRGAGMAAWVSVTALIGTILWLAHRHPYQWDEWPATWRNGLEREAFFTAFAGLLLAVLKNAGQRRGCFLQAAVIFLAWLDVMTHAPRQNPTVERTAYQPGLPPVPPTLRHGVSRAMISAEADREFRLKSVTRELEHYIGNRIGLFSNCNLLDDVPKVNGFFSLYLRETDQVCAMLYAWPPVDLPRLMDFLNVSRVSAPGKPLDWLTRTTSLPLVTAGQEPVFADGTNALSGLAAPEFDPRRTVTLPAASRPFITARAGPAQIADARFESQQAAFDVTAANAAMVVVAQSYYHPWRALVDGRPTRLWRANHAFQALETPPGRHHVRLVYRDDAFTVGALISAATLAGCWAGWIGAVPRDRPDRRPADPSLPLAGAAMNPDPDEPRAS